MTVEAQVRAAKNPQEAMLAIAQGLDALFERLAQAEHAAAEAQAWGDWPAATLGGSLSTPVYEVEGDEDETVVTIPPASEEKRERRRVLADSMDLETQFPGIDVREVYSKGGPVWLYVNDRDFVMGLPVEMRREMVVDVMEDDEQTAHEMARDILKDTDNAGIAKDLAAQRDAQLHG